MSWWSFVGCDSFRDETYGDVKTSGNNKQGRIVQGRNVLGRNVQGRNVPAPWGGRLETYSTNFVVDIPANLSLSLQ